MLVYYKIMKKLHMRTNIGSSRSGCVLITLFQLYDSNAGLSEGNVFWVGQYDPPPPTTPDLIIGGRINPILIT